MTTTKHKNITFDIINLETEKNAYFTATALVQESFDSYERVSAPFVAQYVALYNLPAYDTTKSEQDNLKANNDAKASAIEIYKSVKDKSFSLSVIVEKEDDTDKKIIRNFVGYIGKVSIEEKDSTKDNRGFLKVKFLLLNNFFKELSTRNETLQNKVILNYLKELATEKENVRTSAFIDSISTEGQTKLLTTQSWYINCQSKNEYELFNYLCLQFGLNYTFDYSATKESNSENIVIANKLNLTDNLATLRNSYNCADVSSVNDISQSSGISVKIDSVNSSFFEAERTIKTLSDQTINTVDKSLEKYPSILYCNDINKTQEVRNSIQNRFDKYKALCSPIYIANTHDIVFVPGTKLLHNNGTKIVIEQVIHFNKTDANSENSLTSKFSAIAYNATANLDNTSFNFLDSLIALDSCTDKAFVEEVKDYVFRGGKKANSNIANALLVQATVCNEEGRIANYETTKTIKIDSKDLIRKYKLQDSDLNTEKAITVTEEIVGTEVFADGDLVVIPNKFYALLDNSNTVVVVNKLSLTGTPNQVGNFPKVGDRVVILQAAGDYYLTGYLTQDQDRFGISDEDKKSRNRNLEKTYFGPSSKKNDFSYDNTLCFESFKSPKDYVLEIVENGDVDAFDTFINNYEKKDSDETEDKITYKTKELRDKISVQNKKIKLCKKKIKDAGKKDHKDLDSELKKLQETDTDAIKKLAGQYYEMIHESSFFNKGKFTSATLNSSGLMKLNSDSSLSIKSNNNIETNSKWSTSISADEEISISSKKKITLSVCGTSITIDALGVSISTDRNTGLKAILPMFSSFSIDAYDGISASAESISLDARNGLNLKGPYGSKISLSGGKIGMKGNSFKVSTPTKFDKIRNALEYSNFIEKMATSYGDPYKTRMQKLYNKDNAGYLYVGYDYEHGLNDATDLEKYKISAKIIKKIVKEIESHFLRWFEQNDANEWQCAVDTKDLAENVITGLLDLLDFCTWISINVMSRKQLNAETDLHYKIYDVLKHIEYVSSRAKMLTAFIASVVKEGFLPNDISSINMKSGQIKLVTNSYAACSTKDESVTDPTAGIGQNYWFFDSNNDRIKKSKEAEKEAKEKSYIYEYNKKQNAPNNKLSLEKQGTDENGDKQWNKSQQNAITEMAEKKAFDKYDADHPYSEVTREKTKEIKDPDDSSKTIKVWDDDREKILKKYKDV